MSEQMLGADLILRVLEREGVEVCFGIPGGAVLPLYDAFARGTTVRHVLARHEQGAGHMAEGYARACGRPGVVLATSGPGATNLLTPIANARMDSTPLVCITGQVRSGLIGTDAFQECDIVGVGSKLLKYARQVMDVGELAGVVRDALEAAGEGRPGPVLVDVPRDAQEARVEFDPVEYEVARRPSSPPRAGADAIAAAARALEAARRPILYVGGGAINANAAAELTALVETTGVPVVTTLMAKGVLPESHPLCFGCPGMHGGKWANWGLNMADLIVAVGARFDDRVTGRVDEFAPAAKVVHYDIDPREIGKIRHAEVPVLGELRDALERTRCELREPPVCEEWTAQLRGWRERFPFRYDEGSPRLKPQRALQCLAELVGERRDVVWTTGVGQHQMWAMQYLQLPGPRSFATSGGHGTMGFGLPAAIGARAARPGATVVCVDGDGSFQMTCQELATAVAERLPVVVVILNNAGLGMVHQWQTMFYEERLSAVDLSEPTDCAVVAAGFGAHSRTVHTEAELRAAFADAIESGRTVVLDVRVEVGEQLLPMIKPGAAAVDMVEYEPREQARQLSGRGGGDRYETRLRGGEAGSSLPTCSPTSSPGSSSTSS
jgi:acetolactate synthase-1/2/3 large subunit